MYLIHFLGKAIEVMNGIVLLNDIDSGNVGLPMPRNHQNWIGLVGKPLLFPWLQEMSRRQRLVYGQRRGPMRYEERVHQSHPRLWWIIKYNIKQFMDLRFFGSWQQKIQKRGSTERLVGFFNLLEYANMVWCLVVVNGFLWLLSFTSPDVLRFTFM